MAFVKELSEVGSSSSGGAHSHLISTLVDKMLRSGALQSHISHTLIPEYRKRYYALISVVISLLVPHGVTVESTSQAGTAPLSLPSAKTVAAYSLKEKKLRVAFGHMFVLTGNEGSLARAEEKGSFSRFLTLCWAWHEEGAMREGSNDWRKLLRRSELT